MVPVPLALARRNDSACSQPATAFNTTSYGHASSAFLALRGRYRNSEHRNTARKLHLRTVNMRLKGTKALNTKDLKIYRFPHEDKAQLESDRTSTGPYQRFPLFAR